MKISKITFFRFLATLSKGFMYLAFFIVAITAPIENSLRWGGGLLLTVWAIPMMYQIAQGKILLNKFERNAEVIVLIPCVVLSYNITTQILTLFIVFLAIGYLGLVIAAFALKYRP